MQVTLQTQNEGSGEKENAMELYAFRVGKIWYPKWRHTDQGHEQAFHTHTHTHTHTESKMLIIENVRKKYLTLCNHIKGCKLNQK